MGASSAPPHPPHWAVTDPRKPSGTRGNPGKPDSAPPPPYDHSRKVFYWKLTVKVHLGRAAFERGDPKVDFSLCFTLFFALGQPVASNLPKMAPEIPNIAAKIFNVALKIPEDGPHKPHYGPQDPQRGPQDPPRWPSKDPAWRPRSPTWPP